MPRHPISEAALLLISRLTWFSQSFRHETLINIVNVFRLITENTFRGRKWDRPCLDATITSFRAAHPEIGQKPWAIVTGGNSGIGYETSLALVEAGFRVVLACRSAEKAGEARDRMREELNARYGDSNALVTELDDAVVFILLDLASFGSVRAFVTEFERINAGEGLHVLVNNAGVFFLPFGRTCDGYEQTVGINYLAHFLLTLLLLPSMKRATTGPAPRVVIVSSISIYAATRSGPRGATGEGPDYALFTAEEGFTRPTAYALSKLCDLLFVKYISRRLPVDSSRRITINACHPWGVYTGILRNIPSIQPMVASGRLQNFLRTPAAGATTPVYLALSPEVQEVSGEYFDDMCVMKGPAVVENEVVQEELWKKSLEMSGLEETVVEEYILA
ncbi:hypothetical protein BC937DRAFT_91954 [Endogone sp. FLAS-F59071]|nr:hypothetical protein BC937DRAFT_91954 [Endogone sp. FLAS-F59071]|eukprot:RUS23142.1 hypothetical protein BC937DRAFT_91954 [Endogone sp. FLAS-F59071]